MANKKLMVGIITGIIGLTLIMAVALPVEQKDSPGRGAEDSQVGVIRIEGVIAGEQGQGWLSSSTGSARSIMNQLRSAQRDSGVKAVVIRINSPGGSAASAQEIVEEVQRLRQGGKKVVVSMGDVAASAGYWIAAQADTVVAAPSTLTGSIGVIMEWQNFEQLFNNLGIESEVIKSGPYKDAGSSTRSLTPAEREILQGIVDDTYQQFLDDIAQRRAGKISRENLEDIADGRVFTGRQARDLGLVDELGNFYDAVGLAASLAGIEGEPQVKEYSTESAWDKFFTGLAGLSPYGRTSNLTGGQWWLLPWKGVYHEPGRTYQSE